MTRQTKTEKSGGNVPENPGQPNAETHFLKALLAVAPLDGIDLDRNPDLGRDIDLQAP